MSTIELKIPVIEAVHELLVAELDELGCEGYMQEQDILKAYVPEVKWTSHERESLKQSLKLLNILAPWEEEKIPDQDWNEPWEQSIKPVQAGPFWVRPSWANDDSPNRRDLQEIIIDPKMSFGTGHHETTRLILQKLSSYLKQGDVVLDAGAGTAILAIAAIKTGAESAIAFDIDTWALENGEENIRLNNVSDQIEIRTGSFEVVSEGSFDVIMANINRHILMRHATDLYSRLSDEGYLLLSGVLTKDRSLIEDKFRQAGLIIIDEATDGEWWMGVLNKRNNNGSLSS